MNRFRRFVATAAGTVAVGVLGFATPASAHVSISPDQATQGGYARLAFRVPTESDTASTVGLEVTLPRDAPVGSVSTMPVPGWTVKLTRRTLDAPVRVHGTEISEAVDTITWTATGDAGIKPGEFQEFPLSIGPLPEVDQMVFKAVQRYSDGNVVRWIEAPPPGGGEAAQDPAPVLRLAPAAASSSPPAGAAAPGGPAGSADRTGSAGEDADEADDGELAVALGLGSAGLLAGLAGLVLGGLALARTRPGAGTRPGSTARPGAGTRPGSTARPGTGTRPGSTARPSTGAGSAPGGPAADGRASGSAESG